MPRQKIDQEPGIQERDDLVSGTTPEGVETEEDLGSVDPSLLGRAIVAGTDWTAGTILDQLEKGNIALDPAFQRRDAWKQARKSKFIESIILALPIPQLVLAESMDSRGKFIVIDGKQRLLTLQQFAGINLAPGASPLVLKNLLVRKELNGATYRDLQRNASLAQFLSAFENQPIRTVVVRGWQNEKVLYIIFHRLNTSSVPLSPQELRQALHPGEFLRFAVEYSERSPGLRKMLNLTEPDFRMRDVELLVRYYAYKNFATDYSGSMKDFLDQTCIKLNREWKKRLGEINSQAREFESAVKATFRIFGREYGFRKWDGKQFEHRFNRAAFDIMAFYLSDSVVRAKAISLGEKVKAAFQNLCHNNLDFLRSLETTTKSLEANSIRFSAWGRELRRLGCRAVVPRLGSGRRKG